KEAYEKGLQQLEEEYYTSRGNINELEDEISRLRRQKDHVDLLFDELRDKKTTLKLELNALKERLAVEFSIDIEDLLDTPPPTDAQEDEETLKQKTEEL